MPQTYSVPAGGQRYAVQAGTPREAALKVADSLMTQTGSNSASLDAQEWADQTEQIQQRTATRIERQPILQRFYQDRRRMAALAGAYVAAQAMGASEDQLEAIQREHEQRFLLEEQAGGIY